MRDTLLNLPVPRPPTRRVVCAAIRRRLDGRIICGARHFDDVMRGQIGGGSGVLESWCTAEQGFIDQWGRFMDRREAREVAVAANQIIRRVGSDSEELFSENLY